MIVEVLQSGVLFEIFAVIDLAGGKSIADIFRSPFVWHCFNQNPAFVEICPILPMMRISSGVVLTNFGEI